jgi:tripartite-type tricarboxylate transporter receptor subunit TctC
MGGFGTGTHMGVAQFKAVTGIDIVVIPYKGGGLASADVLAGQVTMMFAGPSSITQHVATGRLRALAVTGQKRLPAMPNVPTFLELGMAGVDSGSYWVSLAPAATPRDIINLLSATMVKVLQMRRCASAWSSWDTIRSAARPRHWQPTSAAKWRSGRKRSRKRESV